MLKKIIIVITLLLSVSSFAQKQKATLYFKDGTKKIGLAKIVGGNQIKFRTHKKSDKVKYDFKLVSKIIIRVNDEDVIYQYKKIKNKKNPVLLEPLEVGEITLYRDLKQGHSAGIPMGAGGMGGMTFGGGSYTISSYYVSKNNGVEVHHLGDKGNLFSKNFKKAAIEYFKDCSVLVKKIEDKEFRKKDVVEIVEYYNTHCGAKN